MEKSFHILTTREMLHPTKWCGDSNLMAPVRSLGFFFSFFLFYYILYLSLVKFTFSQFYLDNNYTVIYNTECSDV